MRWLRRIRGAVGVGITWAIGWAGVGFLIELFVDPHGRIADIWPMVLGIPGFFGGAIFAVVLGMAEGRRRFEELSLARFGAWGALTGALLGVIGAVWIGLSGMLIIPLTMLGAASATGSLALARMGGERELLDAVDASTATSSSRSSRVRRSGSNEQ